MSFVEGKPNVEVFDQNGYHTRSIPAFTYLDYNWVMHDVGKLQMTVPYIIPYNQIGKDSRVIVYRTAGDSAFLSLQTPRIDMGTVWFVRKVERYDNKSEQYTNITAVSLMDLLRRRISAYRYGASKARFVNTPADDVMKNYVNYNLTSHINDVVAGQTWILGSTLGRIDPNFTVEVNLGKGPNVTKIVSWTNILQVCQDLYATSLSLGTPIYFDVVAVNESTFEFRTYKTQLGVNRVPNTPNNFAPVTFSLENGIANVKHTMDWEHEIDALYAAGAGQGSTQLYVEVEDTNSINMAPYARSEGTFSAQHGNTTAEITTDANAELKKLRYADYFDLELVPTPTTQYNEAYGKGDRVGVSVFGQDFQVDINNIECIFDQSGKETIISKFRNVGPAIGII